MLEAFEVMVGSIAYIFVISLARKIVETLLSPRLKLAKGLAASQGSGGIFSSQIGLRLIWSEARVAPLSLWTLYFALSTLVIFCCFQFEALGLTGTYSLAVAAIWMLSFLSVAVMIAKSGGDSGKELRWLAIAASTSAAVITLALRPGSQHSLSSAFISTVLLITVLPLLSLWRVRGVPQNAKEISEIVAATLVCSVAVNTLFLGGMLKAAVLGILALLVLIGFTLFRSLMGSQKQEFYSAIAVKVLVPIALFFCGLMVLGV